MMLASFCRKHMCSVPFTSFGARYRFLLMPESMTQKPATDFGAKAFDPEWTRDTYRIASGIHSATAYRHKGGGGSFGSC